LDFSESRGRLSQLLTTTNIYFSSLLTVSTSMCVWDETQRACLRTRSYIDYFLQ